MKYKIEGTFDCSDHSSIKGHTSLEDTNTQEVQFFIMEGFPSLVVDLIQSLAQKLKEKDMEEDTRLLLLNGALNMCCMNILKGGLGLINNEIGSVEDQDGKEGDFNPNDFNLFDRIGGAQPEK